ncbi:MAG: hypothetical protein HFJ79_09695 [Clostridiales bacterium]|jgi:hypothetical protein|nr:hypothetical protein [Clostridiales bacterium]
MTVRANDAIEIFLLDREQKASCLLEKLSSTYKQNNYLITSIQKQLLEHLEEEVIILFRQPAYDLETALTYRAYYAGFRYYYTQSVDNERICKKIYDNTEFLSFKYEKDNQPSAINKFEHDVRTQIVDPTICEELLKYSKRLLDRMTVKTDMLRYFMFYIAFRDCESFEMVYGEGKAKKQKIRFLNDWLKMKIPDIILDSVSLEEI